MAASEFMKARQTRYGTYAGAYVLVVIAVLIAVNYLSNAHNKSYDATANKQFTLADQTKKIVGDLKNDVTVTYFQRGTDFGRAKDILDRYNNLSSKVHIKYIDPDKDPVAAKSQGLTFFPSVVVANGNRTQVAKSATEEEITSALIRSLKTGDRTACFITGAGEAGIDDQDGSGISTIKLGLEKTNFKTQTVSLVDKPELPSACSVVVVAGPKHDYAQPAVDALKKYLDNGGHAAFFIDPAIDFGRSDSVGNPTNLIALLAGYGVTLNNDLVIDASGKAAAVVQEYGANPIVAPLKRLATVFPLSRSLEVKSPAEKLFSSRDDSFEVTNLKAPIRPDPEKGKKGPFVLGAAATIGGKGRIVVTGGSSWLRNELLGAPIGNFNLALNMMDWLTADEDLISIRPKDPDDRRINLTGRQLSMLFFLLVLVIPMAVILVGTSVYLRRRA